jgi:hypothetical protein
MLQPQAVVSFVRIGDVLRTAFGKIAYMLISLYLELILHKNGVTLILNCSPLLDATTEPNAE